jgi:hypothetical protein
MALPIQDIASFVTQHIEPKTTDVIFKKSPLLTRMLSRNAIDFDGGLYIQRPLMYQKLNGNWFSKNDTFNIAYVVTDTAVQVNMKFLQVSIFLNGTDDVLDRGRAAVFSTVQLKFANAAATMAELLAQGIYQDGQSSGAVGGLGNAGVNNANPWFSTPQSPDGLLAWIDDGNTGYTAATDLTRSFAAIGGNNRSDMFTTAPTFGTPTTPTSAVAGLNSFVNRGFNAFNLNDINYAFGQAWFGNDSPDMIVTTQTGFDRIWNATQPQQRYMDDKADVAQVGFKAFRFNGTADVVVDKYLPNDGTNGVMYLLNTRYLEMHISNSEKFSFGFTGFKDAPNSIDLAGQYLFAGNTLYPNPRMSAKLVGTSLF